MNTISTRLSHAESGIRRIFAEAENLRDELREIRKLSVAEEPIDVPKPEPKIVAATPPPLPREPEVPVAVSAGPAMEQGFAILPESPTPKSDRASLELHLGRVWAVRLGIIMLTTGFVFLSRYTYDNFVRDLGPGIRLGMLYLFSFALAGAGLFFEQWKDTLKNYGRIVAAGGFAAIYYCGFAAHNIESLRVIESPVLASIVLTISAGLFCGISLKRESRVMLATSLGLAFYSISINPIGWMACLSALVLATFGVIMMVRYRWTEIGFVVLISSYLSYFWWQIAVGPASNEAQWFLPSYWILFVVASLFSTRDLSEEHHGIFATLNHVAFFLLFSLDLETGRFIEAQWLFCLILGSALVGLGIFGRKIFPAKTTFLHFALGTSVITLGISLKLVGYQLFLTLLIEALLLIVIHHRMPHPLTRAAAWGIAIFSNLALIGHAASLSSGPWLAGTLGWLALGMIDRASDRQLPAQRLHPPAVFATLIALVFLIGGFAGDWGLVSQILFMISLGLIATLLLPIDPFKERAFDVLWTVLGISLMAPLSLYETTEQAPVFFLAAFLKLAISAIHTVHSKRETNEILVNVRQFIAAFALAFGVALTVAGIHFSGLSPELRLLAFVLIPVAGTLLAQRSGQVTHSAIPFVAYLGIATINWAAPLALLTACLLCLAHLVFLRKKHILSDRAILEAILFLITLALWGAFLDEAFVNETILLTWTSVGLLFLRNIFPKLLVVLATVPFFVLGLLKGLTFGEPAPLYLALLAPLAFHLGESYRRADGKTSTMAGISLLALWYQLTQDAGSQNPAALWAVTGTVFLLIGLFFKSRVFRLTGLVVLAGSLGHLMLVDLVKLEPLPRILSFMTLGFGFLGLGFVYNRWQDRLKQIL